MFRDAQITATAAERFANPLLSTAESPEMVRSTGGDFLTFACQVNQLLANMLDGRPEESTIVNGVEVPFLALFTSSLLKKDFLHEMCV